VIALWEGKSGPHPLATLTQPLQLTGGIGRVKQKMYILGTDPARFTQFYDKVKNDPGWTVHTLPCTTFMQLEMPDELTAILLKAIPYRTVQNCSFCRRYCPEPGGSLGSCPSPPAFRSHQIRRVGSSACRLHRGLRHQPAAPGRVV